MKLAKRAAVVVGASAAAALAVGGYSLGATVNNKPEATACVTAEHVPTRLYAGVHGCPEGTRTVVWQSQMPSTVTDTGTSVMASSSSTQAIAECPKGDVATGGGYDLSGYEANFGPGDSSSMPIVVASMPHGTGGWVIEVAPLPDGTASGEVTPYVECESL